MRGRGAFFKLTILILFKKNSWGGPGARGRARPQEPGAGPGPRPTHTEREEQRGNQAWTWGTFPFRPLTPPPIPAPGLRGFVSMAGFYIHNAPPWPEGKTSPSPAGLPPPQRPEGGATGTSLPNGYLPQSPINPPHVGDACRLHLASSEGDGRSSRFVGCGAGATHSLRSPSRPASVYRNSGSPNPWSSPAAGFPIKGGGQVVTGGSHGSRPPSPQGRAPPFGKGRPGNMGWGVATMAPALRGGERGGGPTGRQECRELGLGGWQG